MNERSLDAMTRRFKNRGGKFSPISTALILYATSASSEAIAAGFIVFMPYRSGGGGPFFGVALPFFVAGGALALAAFAFALIGFRRLRSSMGLESPERAPVVSDAVALFRAGWIVAAVAAVLVFILFSYSVYAEWLAALLAPATIAAILLLLGLAIPPIRLSKGHERQVAWIAFFLGIVGISGDLTSASLSLAGLEVWGLAWLTFGGWPLLNFSVPFGVIVASSAVLLAWCYRKIGTNASTAGC